MKLIALLNPENVSEGEVDKYRVREAVRAVVVDKDGLVALLRVNGESYYKLPGGGIEEGEDEIVALNRERREEIGCSVEIVSELGLVVEYRRIFKLKQTSYCYLARVNGEKGASAFTDCEKGKGFEPIWMKFDEALGKLKSCKATSVEGASYIVPRDIAILTEYLLSNSHE
ncbi:MAG TPA: NUDIX domain-containing protein [Candidatus Paceibacterota bacterium]